MGVFWEDAYLSSQMGVAMVGLKEMMLALNIM
jgi:hypothetical protein